MVGAEGIAPLARGAGFYQKFPAFPDNALVAKYRLLEDGGRYNVTKQESDRHVYRVPSLRNVTLTAPYFHNGMVPTLRRGCASMRQRR
jgi:cytochrome c peroxidase